jgi:hypothetical protein
VTLTVADIDRWSADAVRTVSTHMTLVPATNKVVPNSTFNGPRH